jgi:hypothetical protein
MMAVNRPCCDMVTPEVETSANADPAISILVSNMISDVFISFMFHTPDGAR